MRSKKAGQLSHAKERFLLRLGWRMTTAQLNEIVKLIQSGKGTYCGRKSNRTSRWRLTYQHKTFEVIYDTLRKTIVTVLYDEPKRARS